MVIPIAVTVVGIETDVSDVHPEKAPSPNDDGDNAYDDYDD